MGDTVQDPQWIPEIRDTTEPCIYYVFPYIYIFMMKFNSQIRHSKRLTTITNSIDIIDRTIVTIYCNKSYMNVVSLSHCLIVLYSPFLQWCEIIQRLRDEMKWGHNFCSLRCNSKASTNFFFRLHNFTDRRFILFIDLRSLSILFFFLSLLSWELSPVHLKGALYGFSLVYPGCQYHYSFALGPLLSKIRVD